MKALKVNVAIGLLCLLTYACQEPFGEEYVIEKELQPYVNSFHSEAEKRGWNIPRLNLIMVIKDDLEYRGLSLKRCGQRLVYIDREYYDRAINYERDSILIEFVVFHELGHALLGRAHTTNYYSIMNIKRVDYSGAPREVFMDELFSK